VWDRNVWDCRVVVMWSVGRSVGSIVKRKDVGKPVTQMSLRGQTVKEIRCLSFGTPEVAECAVFILV